MQSSSPSAIIDYSDDQPCDLRLLTPATCLRELSEPLIKGQSIGHANKTKFATKLALPFALSPDLSLIKTEVVHPLPIENTTDPTNQSTSGDNVTGGETSGTGKNGGESSNNSSSSSSFTGAIGTTPHGTGGGGTGGGGAGNIFMCKQCGNSYARPHSLNRHIRFECGVEPKFECPICHKKSKHKHNLVLHMRTHQHR